MDAQKLINDKYTILCTQLGALSHQKNVLDAQVATIIEQIKVLDSLAPEIKKMEATLKAQNGQDQKGNT